MKISNWIMAAMMSAVSVSAVAQTQRAPAVPKTAQTTPAPAAGQAPAAPAGQTAPAPMVLNSLDSTTKADPFPPVNQKYFTAATPTVETVNGFLKQLWGYDPNRIWRVEAIQTTAAPGVSKVVVFVSDRGANAKVQSTAFFVTPDGEHALAGDGVVPFGATPFASTRKMIQARADGASRGAAGKELMLVEFADLQCPHCKDAQTTMEQVVKDFPNARVVFQSFPLVDVHPFAFKAAAYGYCIQKQKNDAYFPYAAAVFDTQTALTPENGDQTLKDAVTKAGLDPAAIDTCATTKAVQDQVNASVKLAQDAGVDQTPMLAVNGHVLPLSQIPYETLKKIIAYQAMLDGVSSGAAAGSDVPNTQPRKAPSLGK